MDNQILSVVLLNIQYLRYKRDELYVFLEILSYPSVVLHTERWLKAYEPLHVPDYLLLSRYARKNSVHGGTLILLHICFD